MTGLPFNEDMSGVICPFCGSSSCELQATGRKTGTVIGGVAGAASGIGGARAGAASGAALAGIISKHPVVLTSGIVLGALSGFFCGAELGHRIGLKIDETVLRLYRCHACGNEFSN